MPNNNRGYGGGQGYQRNQGGRPPQKKEENVRLTAPYQFAALNEKVYFPDWAGQVSQDIPFSNGIDGIIEVTLKNVSPLFTRNGSAGDTKEVYSAHIIEDGQRRYIIPATTLKGMLRSTMEIMSFAKMRLFDDRYFAYRSFHKNEGDDNLYNKYHQAMGTNNGGDYDDSKIGCGWLRMDDDENLYITPCNGRFERIHHNDLPIRPTKKTPFARNEEMGWYPMRNRNNKNYFIVCTGDINKKVKEYLFPEATLKEVKVDESIAKKFMDVHDGPSPDFDKYLRRLKSGERVAVFYAKDNDGQPKAIGLSRMIRYPFDKGVEDLVKLQQPDYASRKHDLCEIIWGYAEKEESLKGRVQIGHAFCTQSISDVQLLDSRGILGQPKASFYPLYLKQSDAIGKFKTYNTATGIAGRKLYKIHRAFALNIPQGNGNENALTHFKAIPSDLTFKFSIQVHNLRPIELGALLSALTLNQTPGTFHNIGMAKAYGFGKIQVTSVRLCDGFVKTAEDYMHDFENEMTIWTLSTMGREWAKTESVNNLISILQEHSVEDVKELKLNGGDNGRTDEFRIVKRKLATLPFRGVGIHSFFTQEDRGNIANKVERKKYEDQYQQALHAINETRYDDAISIYENIKFQLAAKGIITTQEDNLIEEVRKRIGLQEQEEEKRRKEQEEAEKQKKLSAGLASQLEEIYELGPNIGKPKVTNMSLCVSKTKKWLKDADRKELNELERADFIATVRRLRKSPAKGEQKEWATFDRGKVWPCIRQYIGDEAARKLFDEIN